jgi:hypothetical protein
LCRAVLIPKLISVARAIKINTRAPFESVDIDKNLFFARHFHATGRRAREWSKWLEDGDTNRTKTIYLHGTTWTGVYAASVGGEWSPANTVQAVVLWTGLISTTVMALSLICMKRVRKRQD